MMCIYPWQLIGPCPHDIKTGHFLTRTSFTDGIWGGVHCWMNYPYFYTVINPLAALSLPFPNVPTLYVYGTKKRSMFHNDKFLRRCLTLFVKHASLLFTHSLLVISQAREKRWLPIGIAGLWPLHPNRNASGAGTRDSKFRRSAWRSGSLMN